MVDVSVTDLRSHLPEYLRRVSAGEEIRITSRGRVIASLVPARDVREQARAALATLRRTAQVGDVVSPTGETWDAER
jgi:prevent-host-death family protein